MSTTTVDELLREFELKPDDFPNALRTNPVLIRLAEGVPHDLRAEYLGALRDFFSAYQQLGDAQREQMLAQFEAALQKDFRRK